MRAACRCNKSARSSAAHTSNGVLPSESAMLSDAPLLQPTQPRLGLAALPHPWARRGEERRGDPHRTSSRATEAHLLSYASFSHA